jgi:hypothetical protein
MFKVSPACLQTFIDTPNCVLEDRVQYSTPAVILNSNYVIMLSDWNSLKYFCMFLYCTHQVHKDFLITLYRCLLQAQLQTPWSLKGKGEGLDF